MAEFELYVDGAGEDRWRLVASNGRIVADSGEGFGSMRDAQRAMRTAIRTALEAILEQRDEMLRELAFEAGGAATAPLMRDHGDYVFPAERVKAAVEEVLREHGVESA